MKFLSKVCFGFLFLFLFSSSVFSESKKIKTRYFSKSKDLILAIKLVSPPFQQIDTNGNPYGFFYDIAEELASYMNKKLKIVDTSWDGMVSGVRSGIYDIMFVPTTHVETDIINFSIPFMEIDSVLITRKGFSYKGLKSLNNPKIRISVGAKGYDEEIVRRNFPKATLIPLPMGQTPILELIQKKVDFAVFGPASAMKFSKQYPEQLDIHFDRVGRLVMAIAVRKTKDKQLLNTINKFLNDFIKEGKVELLVQKYLNDIFEEYKKYGTEFDCSIGKKWRF